MPCDEVRGQLVDYLIQDEDDSRFPDVVMHLRSCDACRSELQGLKTVWSGLADIPNDEPRLDARNRFERTLDIYRHAEQESSHTRTRFSWFRGGLWSKPLLQFGFGLALLLFGVALGFFARQPQAASRSSEIAELRGELSAMREMVTLSLMQQQSAAERLRGVNWSSQLQQPGQEVVTALLDTLTHDSNVNVRLATVDALRQFGDQPVVRKGVIAAVGQQASPMVQVALIDLAVDLGEKESAPVLRRLSQDQSVDVAVRDRARRGLEALE